MAGLLPLCLIIPRKGKRVKNGALFFAKTLDILSKKQYNGRRRARCPRSPAKGERTAYLFP
jgi:hypothetical protein